jgi:hypothetical protein
VVSGLAYAIEIELCLGELASHLVQLRARGLSHDGAREILDLLRQAGETTETLKP